MHLELLSYSATAPSTGAAAAATSPDSLTIKNATGNVKIIAWWTKNQVIGSHTLTFPSGHDTSRGIRVHAPVGIGLHDIPVIDVKPQELLSVSIVGSAVAGDVEAGCFLVHYPNLPGTTGRFITAPEFEKRQQELLTIALTQASTAGIYGVQELISAETDLMKANTDYAILGINSSLTTLSNNLLGPDIGNLRVGCPPPSPLTNTHMSEGFFYRLAQRTGLPCIPVINSGNRVSTYVGQSTDENVAASVQYVHAAILN